MTPPISANRALTSPHAWPDDPADSEPDRGTNRRQAQVSHEWSRHKTWDQLDSASQVQKQKNAENVIRYLEDRLSQLTEVGDSEDRVDSETHKDPFSAHHQSVIEEAISADE